MVQNAAVDQKQTPCEAGKVLANLQEHVFKERTPKWALSPRPSCWMWTKRDNASSLEHLSPVDLLLLNWPFCLFLKHRRRMWNYLVSCVVLAMFPGSTLNQNCMHQSVVEYLNVSHDNRLFLYTRPKKNWTEPLEVTLDFTLVSILAVVEKLQVITSYFWLFVVRGVFAFFWMGLSNRHYKAMSVYAEKWNNDFVSWNASDFCNITHLTLPADKFWIPEIAVEEQANEEKARTSPFVRISSDGEIMQFQEYHLTSSCSLNIYRFPFDKQNCNITVLSPMHSAKEVIMKSREIDVEVDANSRNLYLTNGEWKFNNISFSSHIISGVQMDYSAVTYQIFMQRRPVLYVLNLIFPTSALFIMDMAISCTYVSSDKINFKITMILEVSVLSLILNEILPTSSDYPPLIAKFFSGIFLLMVVGPLENYLGMYLQEMEPPCWFLKSKRLFTGCRKKKNPVHVLHPEEEEPCNHTPAGKDCAEKETYKFLRRICSELQLMRKELSPRKNPFLANDEDWNRSVRLVERVLCITRTLFSVLFLAYIVQQWTTE